MKKKLTVNTNNCDSKCKSKFLLSCFLSICSLLVVMTIWLPFGFSLTGLLEEWGVLGHYIQSGLFFITGINSPLAIHAVRPLTIFPHSLAYFLDSNSFYYWHVLLMLSLIIKGSSASYLFWKATQKLNWAVLMGILFLLYPADTMQLSFRAVHINWALASALLGCGLFVSCLDDKSNSSNSKFCFIRALIGSLVFFAGMCMYEAAIMFVPIPFFILYIRNGFEHTIAILKKNKGLLLLWLITVAAYVAYVSFVSLKISTYQDALMGEHPVRNYLVRSFSYLFTVGIFRTIFGAWFDAVNIALTEFKIIGYLYLSFSASLLFALVVFARKINHSLNPHLNSDHKSDHNSPHSSMLRLCSISILLIALGYFPFLSSLSHILISQRTFLFASFGGAMFCTAVVMMISTWHEKLAYLLSFVLILAGLGAQLFQFHHYVQLSIVQKNLLKNIVEQFDGNLNDKTLVIRDESNLLNHTWMFLRPNLLGALSYFYDQSLPPAQIQICSIPQNWWQLEDNIHPGRCSEKKESWIFSYPESSSAYESEKLADLNIAKDKIIILTIKKDGSVANNPNLKQYHDTLYQNNSNAALRFRHILLEDKWPTYFEQFWVSAEKDTYEFNLGKWWNLEPVTRGQGWSDPAWKVGYLHHHSFAWKQQENALLYFEITPSSNNYVLLGKITTFLNSDIQKTVKIIINGHTIDYHWLENSEHFEARLPANTLFFGLNSIEFKSELEPKDHLSFRLLNFKLTPLQSNTLKNSTKE